MHCISRINDTTLLKKIMTGLNVKRNLKRASCRRFLASFCGSALYGAQNFKLKRFRFYLTFVKILQYFFHDYPLYAIVGFKIPAAAYGYDYCSLLWPIFRRFKTKANFSRKYIKRYRLKRAFWILAIGYIGAFIYSTVAYRGYSKATAQIQI